MKLWRLFGLAALTGVLLLSSGCCACGIWPFHRYRTSAVQLPRTRVERPQVGELRTEHHSLVLGDATRLRATITLEVGELRVAGGAKGMLDADFSYNVDAWKPEIRSQVRNGLGELEVRQPRLSGVTVDDRARNEWDLRLPDNVPLDLRINGGVGRHDLRLSGLDLTRLDVNVGVGEMHLDLSGAWDQDVDVTINGGVGEAVIRLPHETGVRVDVRGGLGSIETTGLHRDGDAYVNEAYGRSETTLRIEVRGGLGEVILETE